MRLKLHETFRGARLEGPLLMRVAIYGQTQDTGLVIDFCRSHCLQGDLYSCYVDALNFDDYQVVFALVDGMPESDKVIRICTGLVYVMGAGPEPLLARCDAVLKDAIFKITSQTCTVLFPELSPQIFASEIIHYVKPPYKIPKSSEGLCDILGPNQCCIDECLPNIVMLNHSLKLLDVCFEDYVSMLYVVRAEEGEDYTTFLVAKGFYVIAKSQQSQPQSIWVNTRALFTRGPQRVDMVYYINLDYRTDRNAHILRQFADYDIVNFQRISAIKEDNGALGCSKSHVKALETFLASQHDICIVLEDDFMFTMSKAACTQMFNAFFQTFHVGSWDVVQLAAWTLLSEPVDCSDIVDKCLFSLTTSGYMVNRRFAKTLLSNFQESIALLESCRAYERRLYALDVYWGKLQPVSMWYVFNPKMGKQIESYSDVIGAVSNYGV